MLPSILPRSAPLRQPDPQARDRVILSFDVEEHYRIEAATTLEVEESLKARYASRMDDLTRWLLDQLADYELQATFFVVGQCARDNAALVRAIHEAGHEVACHSWNHQGIHRLTPTAFREDLRRAKDALQQAIGQEVLGYRAPTFSIGSKTVWAIDVLAEEGFQYDSSIFPVHHDRYGVPSAPRTTFRVRGEKHELLEFPPATWRCLGVNIPAGGGGYFRLFPTCVTDWAVGQGLTARESSPVMLYFHPWEFDPDQPRLPLKRVDLWRTYVGIGRTRERLQWLLKRHGSCRAIDAAKSLDSRIDALPSFTLARQSSAVAAPETNGHMALSAAFQRLE